MVQMSVVLNAVGGLCGLVTMYHELPIYVYAVLTIGAEIVKLYSRNMALFPLGIGRNGMRPSRSFAKYPQQKWI
jgi:hypothetical protein